ncbi:MAG TPA: efflux RND transporter periplasmic adaptor subunit [Verrucomicrobiae bacterium]
MFSLLGVVIAALATVAAVRKREIVIEIQTDRVARRDITEVVVANGKIQPVVQVVINPEVSGEIIALPVKEGQNVKKGDLLLKIKPDNYIAQRNSMEANHLSAVASQNLAKANMDKAEVEFERVKRLGSTLVSESDFLTAKTSFEVAKASYETACHQTDQAKAGLARADDDLSKTTIVSPIDGTVCKLRSQLGERVVGTAMMAGTEVLTVANLNDMEARVDIGESDVVLIALQQKARLEVEAFRDRKFNGVVTEIANASKTPGAANQGQMSSSAQEATKFEVKIRIQEKEVFRPGMTVTAEIETRSVTNVLAVPIQSVTTRVTDEDRKRQEDSRKQAALTKDPEARQKKEDEAMKVPEIVFVAQGDRVKKQKVKTGISDDTHIEIVEGLKGGEEVVIGGYKAISRELDDDKKVRREDPEAKRKKQQKKKEQE